MASLFWAMLERCRRHHGSSSIVVLQQCCSSSSVTTFRGLLGRVPALEQVRQFALYFRLHDWLGRMPGYLRYEAEYIA
ncbi:hypothetical protein BJX65DRAFT_284902 [Aspergillus insuetus]